MNTINDRDTIADATDLYQARAVHTYGGGLRTPGTRVTTFCGITTTAEGISYPYPPANACGLCLLAWQTNKTKTP